MSDDATIIERIRDFVMSNFPLAKERALSDDDSLLDGGIVDSLGVLDIVTFLEGEFDIEMSDEDLVADSFETVGGIAAVVQQKKQAQTNQS